MGLAFQNEPAPFFAALRQMNLIPFSAPNEPDPIFCDPIFCVTPFSARQMNLTPFSDPIFG